MKITRRQLTKIIKEALGDRGDLPKKHQYKIGMRGPEDLPYGNVTGSKKPKQFSRTWNSGTREWGVSDDWAALEDDLLLMDREDIVDMLVGMFALGGSFTLRKLQDAVDARDMPALDKIAHGYKAAEKKQTNPKYGRY